jgi:DNA-binding winged helix-turn-helix (wHTH) protein
MASNVRRGATRELEVYEISDLVIDLARQRVTRAAAEIALPKLSFDMLLAFVRAAPAVLSNNDLMAQVWPGLVVSPETVSRRVKMLRDALGDDPRAPRYIAGLRGRGYRLIPEVRSVEEAPARRSPQPSPVLRFGEFLSDLDGRLAEGRVMLDRALLSDPLSARAYYIRAHLTQTAAEAEQMLLTALKIDPQFTSALKQLSLMRSFQGEFAEGVMLAERAIAVDPVNPWSRSRHRSARRPPSSSPCSRHSASRVASSRHAHIASRPSGWASRAASRTRPPPPTAARRGSRSTTRPRAAVPSRCRQPRGVSSTGGC